MNASLDIMTVMFADVAGSSRIYERVGDEKASDIIDNVIHLMSEIVITHSGHVVKTIGDEIMCRFSSADDAYTTSCLIQEILQTHPCSHGIQLRARIGMHTGSALLRSDGDVFGDAVNVAARVTEIARSEQVITTQDTVDALSPLFRTSCHEFDRIALRGRSSETTIYNVVWENDENSCMSTRIRLTDTIPSAHQLQLYYQGAEVTLNPDSPALVIGRGPDCDIVLHSSHASRLHAKIEFRRGKFVIIDQSTNGTFVKSADGKEVFLKREELPLLGTGVISMGFHNNRQNPQQISFLV